MKIAVLGQVSNCTGRGMKDIKGTRLTRIADRIIHIIIQMTGTRVHMNTDLKVPTYEDRSESENGHRCVADEGNDHKERIHNYYGFPR